MDEVWVFGDDHAAVRGDLCQCTLIALAGLGGRDFLFVLLAHFRRHRI